MSKNKSRSNIPKLKIGPKTMDGAGSSIEEASPTSNKPQNLPDECELAAHRLYEKAMQEFISKKTIRNNQVNLTPAQAVAKLQKAFPNSEVRLSREGDPELSSVFITSFPQSGLSKKSTPPEQFEKNSQEKQPDENQLRMHRQNEEWLKEQFPGGENER